MHFYESSIITTKDGLHCQVYANEHPTDSILVKPKYIPTDKIESAALQYRFIAGKKMNRLDMWAEKEQLKKYIDDFKQKYPQYVYNSTSHESNRLIFSVPIDNIERVYFPRTGLKELMGMPTAALDEHLKTVHEFIQFLMKSGITLHDMGITYSTLMGHYLSKVSDINIVIYSKEKFWKLMEYLKTAEHTLLRWKTMDEWLDFYKKRNRHAISQELFLKSVQRKRSEGFFNDTLFVIFAVEREEEVVSKWGSEQYIDKGIAIVEGVVTSDLHSVTRPGYYEIKDATIPEVKKVVFHSRDYCMLAKPGEKIQACGILEEVIPKNSEPYHRVVVGYLDAYTTERREKEFIRLA